MPQLSTGITGLDEMLKGGLPKGRVILLCGGPGTGKTIFSLELLCSVVEKGVHGVYATLEEPLKLIKENVETFAWNIGEKEKKQSLKLLEPCVVFCQDSRKESELSPLSVTTKIINAAKSIQAQLIIIDPLTSIVIHAQRAGEKRRKITELFNQLRSSGYTSLVTSETSSSVGEFYIEEFLADGVIRLDKVIRNFNLIRTIRIEKMRGVKHDEQPRQYIIDDKGFTVYSTEPIKV